VARNPRSSATKARGTGKARKGSASKARSARKSSAAPTRPRAAAKKGGTSTRRARTAGPAGESWSGALETLVSSSLGRDILADALEAAAGALRRGRGELQETVTAGARAIRDTSSAAIDAGTEMVTGAASLAQSAAEVLADAVTSSARSLLPGKAENETRQRAAKRTSSREEKQQ
jgi:hypothetical protein